MYEKILVTLDGTPSDRAARATANSASGCSIACTPTGATSNGVGRRRPSSSTLKSRRDTLRRKRGTMRQRRKASRLARTVSSAPAPPAT